MVTIREVQATVNGFTGADKTVSLTTCVAGDTLVIAHACNTNPFPSDPTSDAGALTLEASVTNGFSGRCRLSVYTCTVGSTATKTVTFTGGSGGDVAGHAVVLAGAAIEDGTSTEDGVDGSSATHVMNTLTTSVATDLLLAFFSAFNTSAGADYYSPGASGMTKQAESYDTGFLLLASFSEQLSASGPSGTRTVVPVTSDNRYVSVGIALRPAVIAVGSGRPLVQSSRLPLIISSAVTKPLVASTPGGSL